MIMLAPAPYVRETPAGWKTRLPPGQAQVADGLASLAFGACTIKGGVLPLTTSSLITTS